ncbi:MAG TPA: hypothetical protein VF743_08830 [Acidimicrobiales bacterium]
MRKILATLALAVVLAAACSSPSDEDPTADGSDAGTTADDGERGGDGTATTADDGGSDRSGDAGSGGEGGDDADREVLGTATAELPAAPTDETLVPLRLDVLSLRRLEGMVELHVALTNEGETSDPAFAPYSAFDDPRLPRGQGVRSLSGAALVDADAERAYLTLIDSEGGCLCTSRLDTVQVAPGDTFEMVADFGGVPDDVDRLDVQVPGFPTVDGVPVG